MTEVTDFIANEESNADYWLQPETRPNLVKILDKELITNQAQQLITKESGVTHMLEQCSVQELKSLF